MPAPHHRHAALLVCVGLGIDLEFRVEHGVEPGLDDPIAERRERRIALRVAQVRQGVEDPVGALPLGVDGRGGVRAVSQMPRQEVLDAGRCGDLGPERTHRSGLAILAEDVGPDLPSDRRLVRPKQVRNDIGVAGLVDHR